VNGDVKRTLRDCQVNKESTVRILLRLLGGSTRSTTARPEGWTLYNQISNTPPIPRWKQEQLNKESCLASFPIRMFELSVKENCADVLAEEFLRVGGPSTHSGVDAMVSAGELPADMGAIIKKGLTSIKRKETAPMKSPPRSEKKAKEPIVAARRKAKEPIVAVRRLPAVAVEGDIMMRPDRRVKINFVQPEGSVATVLAIGGLGGGFYGPAYVYDWLATTLPAQGIALLRVDVSPDHMNGYENVMDALKYLREVTHNSNPILLMGWSMGGASIIHAAKHLLDSGDFPLRGLITLAGQSYGADPIKGIQGVPISILHGTADTCMGPRVAESIYQMANEPKSIHFLEGAGHFMEERREELSQRVWDFIMHCLLKKTPI
jgi:alpha/beta superfamily hydrolase